MSMWSHFSQRATWPPSAAVRQRSIADITLSWPRLTWPALALRHAGPSARKISATSSAGRATRAASGGRRHDEVLERAPDLADSLGGDLGVERRGVELLVPEQHLDHADVDLLLQEMGGEAVPQRVERDTLVDPGHLRRGMAGTIELACRQRLHRIAAREQPTLWPCRLPIGAQQLQQMPGQHDVAILVPLALLDPDDHPGAIDVADLERDHFVGPQARAIGHAQRRSVLEARGSLQEARDLLRAQNHRQLAGLANERHALRDLAPPKRHGEEEPQRRHRRVLARRRWRPAASDSAAGPPRLPGPASGRERP